MISSLKMTDFQFMRRLCVLLTLCMSVSFFAIEAKANEGGGCQELVQPSGRHLKILSRLEKLNPSLAKELSASLTASPSSLENLYLRLKQEAWTYLPLGILPFSNRTPLPKDVQQSLIENFHKQYSVESLNEEKLTLFYANAIWALYISVLQNWSEEIAQVMWESSEAMPRPLNNFGVSILSRSLIGADLQSQSLSLEMATQVFKNKEWENFPWTKAYGIASDWLAQNIEREKLNYKTVRTWMESHPLYTEIDPKQRAIIEEGLLQPGLEEVCCKSEPGCAFCPNNRSWLKTSKSE